MQLVDVLLPLPLPGSFSYLLAENQSVLPGQRVIVPFGKRKIYTGVVLLVHEEPAPKESTLKSVIDVLDEDPILANWQLDYFQWMADYYMCTAGEVLNAALPAGLKLNSESFVSLHPTWNWAGDANEEFRENEQRLVHLLGEGEKSIAELAKDLDIKHPQRLIQKLREKQVVQVYERVHDRYRPKVEKMIRLTPHFRDESVLETLFQDLEKKTKQLDVLLAYLRDVDIQDQKGVARKQLLTSSSRSSIQTLIKHGVLEEWERPVSRLPAMERLKPQVPTLSDPQQRALNEIHKLFESKSTVLLHGITGSGKTEIYIQLIHDVMEAGGQVLYLLPEIALTTQIIKRLQKVFGQSFGVYHSHYSDNERVEVWQKVLNQEYSLVVGVRSAIFLPFESLDLVIVDEEHEPSYKQHDPAPRYHARDTAIYLASLHHANVLLGSATPSVETYYKAKTEKFGLIKLNDRFGDSRPPTIERIDTRASRKQRQWIADLFSQTLLDAISEALDKKEQVILFQNRRGYAPYLSCMNCGEVVECPNCDVSLTYHQYHQQLICHYCGYRRFVPDTCPSCGQAQLVHSGSGTEQLEEQLQPLFKEATIQRMDLDTTRNKYSYQRILNEFEEGHTDILIGTQMISKGLDFHRVNTVGIFDVDRLLYFPDFRSHERAFQLITQVSGRAGRQSHVGRAFLQTNNPNHPVLESIVQQDYEDFYQQQVMDREAYNYPPFYRIIQITIKHRDAKIAKQGSEVLAKKIGEAVEQPILGPTDALIPRIRNFYHREIQIKIANGQDLVRIKGLLWVCREQVLSLQEFRSLRIVFDVDPQ